MGDLHPTRCDGSTMDICRMLLQVTWLYMPSITSCVTRASCCVRRTGACRYVYITKYGDKHIVGTSTDHLRHLWREEIIGLFKIIDSINIFHWEAAFEDKHIEIGSRMCFIERKHKKANYKMPRLIKIFYKSDTLSNRALNINNISLPWIVLLDSICVQGLTRKYRLYTTHVRLTTLLISWIKQSPFLTMLTSLSSFVYTNIYIIIFKPL